MAKQEKEKKPKKGKFVIGITLKGLQKNELSDEKQSEVESTKPKKEKAVIFKHCVCDSPDVLELGVDNRFRKIRHCKTCKKFLLKEEKENE